MKLPVLRLRAKLVLIFMGIKVLPLVLLAWLAWNAADRLGLELGSRASAMSERMVGAIREVGDKVTEDAIVALDDRAREAIERLSTDTAHAVADFLYARDHDVLEAAALKPDEAAYRQYLEHRVRHFYQHGEWKLAPDGKAWVPAKPVQTEIQSAADPSRALADNAKAFHARPFEYRGERIDLPLYVEMSFIDLDGRERVKVSDGKFFKTDLLDVSRRENTFVKAETYWPALKRLKPGEVYVSDVIGAYVPSPVVGPYTPDAAKAAGIEFAPRKAAYAGTENPLGKRFQGIVRWATPVLEGGKIIGYVTLALDHEHIRQFTDRIVPTDARYTSIIDPIAGNYAFMWDYKDRAIAHPRDYMIVGYDPASGLQVPPWMDEELYIEWKNSGLGWREFSAQVPAFRDQSLQRKPAAVARKAGFMGLDCRYLNFSPQCAGWHQLTENGGSGSFEIFFSGLRKLTTAAAIPYFTGQYGKTPRGFGFITIGANVDDFHRAATQSAKEISTTIDQKDQDFRKERLSMLELVDEGIRRMARELAGSTFVMVLIVIGIAFWMASFLTRHIKRLVDGIKRFEEGKLDQRFEENTHDEMGELNKALNRMAGAVDDSFKRSEEARLRAEEANRMKSDFLASVSHELRTPLNGILGFADLLILDLKDPELREQALTIKSSGAHLLGVVNDLLDLAKVESGKMQLHPEPVDLAPFLADVVAGHRAHAQNKGLELLLDMGREGRLPVVELDSLRLRQVLNNLINNAIKYTEKGRITVQAEMDRAELVFVVRDTGCGIAYEDQEAVFDKFGGVGGKIQRDKGGSGLGLSLVRRLVQLMDGQVSLESKPGHGSVFKVVIPAHLFVASDTPDDGAGL